MKKKDRNKATTIPTLRLAKKPLSHASSPFMPQVIGGWRILEFISGYKAGR